MNSRINYNSFDVSDINAVVPSTPDEDFFKRLKNSYIGRSICGIIMDANELNNSDNILELFEEKLKNNRLKIYEPTHILFVSDFFISTSEKMSEYMNVGIKFPDYLLVNPKARNIYECDKWEYELLKSMKKVMSIKDVVSCIEKYLKVSKTVDKTATQIIKKWELNKVIRYSFTDEYSYHEVTDVIDINKKLVHHQILEKPEVKFFRIVLTQNCDLKCVYCYYGDEDLQRENNNCHATITKEQLRTTIDYIYNITKQTMQDNISIQWWGGDPALCEDLIIYGTEYAKSIFPKSFNLEFAICSSFVSNNTDEFINFMIDNGFRITISLDGPPEINNYNKKLLHPEFDGDSSFYRTMQVFKKIARKIPSIPEQLKNVDNVHITKNQSRVKFRCTLRIDDIDKYPDICSFFEKIGYSYRICLVSDDNVIANKEKFQEKMIEQYHKANDIILSAYNNDEPIEKLSSLFCNAHTNPMGGLRFLYSRCGFGGGILIVNTDGKIYTCHRFCDIEDFHIGTVSGNIVELIKNNSKLRKRWSMEYDKCKGCVKQSYCTGGCAYESYTEYKSIWKTPTCPNDELIIAKVITNYLFSKAFPGYRRINLNVEACHTVRNIWC